MLKDGTVKALVVVTFSYGGRMPALEDSGQYITRVTSSLFWVRWVEACLQRSVTLSLDCLVVTFSAVPSYLKSMKWKSWRAHIWVVMVCGQESHWVWLFLESFAECGPYNPVLGKMARVSSVSRNSKVYWTYYQSIWFRHIYISNLRGFWFGSIYGGANLRIRFAPYWLMDFTFGSQSKSYLCFPYYQPCIHKNCCPLPISTTGGDAFGLTGCDWLVFARMFCRRTLPRQRMLSDLHVS